jgi:pentapeptide repeat protein
LQQSLERYAERRPHSDMIEHDNPTIADHVRDNHEHHCEGHSGGWFDPAAWKGKLFALNPWARGLTIDEASAKFCAARRKATLARHAQGIVKWNAWVNGMVRLRATLEAAGQWAAQREPPLTGKEATHAWLGLASAVFSEDVLKHRFEKSVSFVRFVFPGDARFSGATFGDEVHFSYATFGGVAGFGRATFSGLATFSSATFGGKAEFKRPPHLPVRGEQRGRCTSPRSLPLRQHLN